MSSTPPISVIVPTYNRASFLRKTLTSIQQQTLKPLEIILIDDGSTDKTQDMCQQDFPEVKYFYQENKGVSAARNLGIRKARGEWIAFLDSDDLWDKEKLMTQWSYLEDNPQTKILQTDEIWIRKGRRVNPKTIHQKKSGWIFEDCLPLCRIAPSAVMIHRSVFDEVGAFDEALPACEDYDLWLRIALRYPIATLPEKLIIKHGGHDDQLSSQHSLDRYRIQALLKILQDPLLNKTQTELVRSDIRRRCQILIKGLEKRGKISEANFFRHIFETALSEPVGSKQFQKYI